MKTKKKTKKGKGILALVLVLLLLTPLAFVGRGLWNKLVLVTRSKDNIVRSIPEDELDSLSTRVPEGAPRRINVRNYSEDKARQEEHSPHPAQKVNLDDVRLIVKPKRKVQRSARAPKLWYEFEIHIENTTDENITRVRLREDNYFIDEIDTLGTIRGNSVYTLGVSGPARFKLDRKDLSVYGGKLRFVLTYSDANKVERQAVFTTGVYDQEKFIEDYKTAFQVLLSPDKPDPEREKAFAERRAKREKALEEAKLKAEEAQSAVTTPAVVPDPIFQAPTLPDGFVGVKPTTPDPDGCTRPLGDE